MKIGVVKIEKLLTVQYEVVRYVQWTLTDGTIFTALGRVHVFPRMNIMPPLLKIFKVFKYNFIDANMMTYITFLITKIKKFYNYCLDKAK